MKYKTRLTFVEECPADGKFYVSVSYKDEDDDHDDDRESHSWKHNSQEACNLLCERYECKPNS